MKNRFFIILLLTGIFSCQSDPGSEVKKDELKTILSDYYNAMARKELAKMNALTTHDFVLFENGDVFNNESAVRAVEEMGAFTVQFKFDSLNTYFGKANASAYYFREAILTARDSTSLSVKFLESATFEKQDGKWKIRFLHSSKRK
ncbi:MAG: nuclear transport factor 2 family protein [Bacteroidota bacterium]|nr:nuclear transport factor 2 family protein [Bacteroidota bacterium]